MIFSSGKSAGSSFLFRRRLREYNSYKYHLCTEFCYYYSTIMTIYYKPEITALPFLFELS